MLISKEYKQKVQAAMLDARGRHSGSDSAYAQSMGISAAIYSRINAGELDKVLSDANWMRIGKQLQVSMKGTKWVTAETQVYIDLRESFLFCQIHSRSMILVDECGIGKTHCAKSIIRQMTDAFYIDCSQAKSKTQFIRLLAKTIGVPAVGKLSEVIDNIKYYLTSVLNSPFIVLDEAGDLEYSAFLLLKELWNATEGQCGWFLMGADGLRNKIQRGIVGMKVGYREIFSRYNDTYLKLVTGDKEDFYSQLIADVAHANVQDKKKVETLVKQCLGAKGGEQGTLRRLQTIIYQQSIALVG